MDTEAAVERYNVRQLWDTTTLDLKGAHHLLDQAHGDLDDLSVYTGRDELIDIYLEIKICMARVHNAFSIADRKRKAAYDG